MNATATKRRTIRLSPYQRMVFQHPARFRVLVAGRRFGKTFLANVESLTHAVNHAGSICWYVAPTYKQAKEIAWRDLKALVPREYVIGRPNESDLSITLLNGSRIALKGADNYDSLRGPGLDFLVPDEFALIDPRAWAEVLRPMLSDRVGRALFITTPRGLNWAYDLYLRGQNGNDQWQSWQYTTLEGGNVTADEIAEARATLDPRTFRQEYEASFETLAGRVYSNFDRDGNTGPVEDTGGDVLVGMDFNVNPMSAVVAVRNGGQCHVLHALEIQTSNTDEMATELRQRYPDRRVIVCPDPSGKARKTSAPVGQTDFTILRNHGFEVRAPSKAPPVVDRINNTQALLCNADGDRRLFVDPSCTKLIRALDGLTYKDGTSQVDKTLGLDHICFVGGTRIATASGSVPVETLVPGDLVLTRFGVSPVTHTCVRLADVWTLTLDDGTEITGTPDHPFHTVNAGLVPLFELTPSHTLVTCEQTPKVLSSTASRSGAIPTHPSESYASTSRPAVPTALLVSEDYTKRYGAPLTAQSLAATTSTTSTATRSTTTSRTLSASRPATTSPITWATGEAATRTAHCSSATGSRPQSGTGRPRVASGIRSTASEPGHHGNLCPERASTAGPGSTTSRAERPAGSVRGRARAQPGGHPVSMTRTVRANGATPPSASTATLRSGIATCPAPRMRETRPARRAPVYNIRVADHHEYFANGILVSNCDALDYLCWQEFNVLKRSGIRSSTFQLV